MRPLSTTYAGSRWAANVAAAKLVVPKTRSSVASSSGSSTAAAFPSIVGAPSSSALLPPCGNVWCTAARRFSSTQASANGVGGETPLNEFAAALKRDEERNARRGGGGGAAAGRPSVGGSSSSPLAPGTPLKDRVPPRLFSAQQATPRLAVLIDGSKVTPEGFFSRIHPRIIGIGGSPLFYRIFDSELKPAWQRVIVERGAAEGFEWFRVERFIPVTMQMSADARHIATYRTENAIDGVAYCCNQLEGTLFARYLDRVTGVKQFLLTDEDGLIATRATKDGGHASNAAATGHSD